MAPGMPGAGVVHLINFARRLTPEDRYDNGSTLVTSQAHIKYWRDMIGNPTLADAILDRLAHNAYRIELSGKSKRKETAPDEQD